MAKKTLKENLKQEYQVTLTVDGSTKYMAGMIIELDESWGKFEGKYVIDKAKHSITGDYSCELECMKVGARKNAEQNAKAQTKEEQKKKEAEKERKKAAKNSSKKNKKSNSNKNSKNTKVSNKSSSKNNPTNRKMSR